ncbi:MAG TPA: Hpt domain-containing protein [Ramlibacter sp.]|uniref:Hpt domain-containing protein n=1 Tax=Ramlibacter sp. TaxID=1917967 RepID=UPI002D802903|nr:Hpt domain-containing protein [Ramlibacter sp.]HET8744607.1 Hpt domain-containing protein [Ramlibacter sp.]
MNHPTGTSRHVPAPLAGRRILLATPAASLAEPLRQAGAEVLHARPGAALPGQLRAAGRLDAAILALDAPEALESARAVRAGNDEWAAIPLLGLAADPNACAEAARAAGIDGLLGEPLETTLLYETLTRFITGGAARMQRIQPAAPALATTVVPEALLNVQRLQSYQRVGMLEEVVHDYLPELRRLLGNLEEAAARCDQQGAQAALHSLLGMSGEAGAQALYQQVRKIYVPLLEHGQWPAAADWLPQLQQLAARTEEALKAYSAGQARSGAA